MGAVRKIARKRWSRVVAVMMVLLLAALLPAGCISRITPPAAPAEPVTVWLADHGRTSSLIIPSDDQTMVRYAFGDWQWYALDRTSMWRGIAAIFWPTRAAFGRMELRGAGDASDVRRAVAVPIQSLHAIVVERDAARNLRARLDALHAARASTAPALYSRSSDLHMVTHPRRYHALFNSNHASAGWMREMGVGVSRPTLLSKWRVKHERR